MCNITLSVCFYSCVIIVIYTPNSNMHKNTINYMCSITSAILQLEQNIKYTFVRNVNYLCDMVKI